MREFDDHTLLRMLGGIGVGPDWIAIFTFFAIAFTYFLAPVLGYHADRRLLLALALYLVLIYGFMTLLQMVLLYYDLIDEAFGGPRRGNKLFHIQFLFSIAKLAVLPISLFLYVMGLQALGRRKDDIPN